jgi:C4-dicarboxylate transporter DctM subunit
MDWAITLGPLVMLVLGFPIFVILIATSAIVLLFFMQVPFTQVHQVMFGSVDKFALLAVPYFIFAGEIMSVGGMSSRIVNWMLTVFGNIRGSRGYTTVGACVVFGAISGSSVATVASVGRLMYPSLRERYGEKFAAGIIASTGSIDILIPPSIAMILYGAAAEQSVALLFIAGVFPGLLMALFQASYVYWYAHRHNIRDGESFRLATFLTATYKGVWALGAPVVILGGIYGGIVSPTEAAGFACVYGILVTVCVYREVSLKQLWEISVTSMYLTAQILIIVACAGVFSWLLTVSNIPQTAVALLQGFADSQWVVLIIVNIFLLIVGCFIDPGSAILVLTPLLVPIMKAYGVDLVHFGIVMTMNLAIGMFTPPFGLNIFVTQALTKAPLKSIYPGLVPYIILTFLALLVVTYVPWLSLYLTKFV